MLWDIQVSTIPVHTSWPNHRKQVSGINVLSDARVHDSVWRFVFQKVDKFPRGNTEIFFLSWLVFLIDTMLTTMEIFLSSSVLRSFWIDLLNNYPVVLSRISSCVTIWTDTAPRPKTGFFCWNSFIYQFILSWSYIYFTPIINWTIHFFKLKDTCTYMFNNLYLA